MRFHQNARLAHLVFLKAQNLAQPFHLPAHMLQHLVDGVHLDVALLIFLQGELDGHVLGRLHQHVAVGFLVANGCRKVCQQPLQVQARVGAGGLNFLLQLIDPGISGLRSFAELRKQANSLHHFFFLQWNGVAVGDRRTRSRAGSSSSPRQSGDKTASARTASRSKRKSSATRSATAATSTRTASTRTARTHGNRAGSYIGASATASAIRTLRGCDELQQLLRVVQPLLEFRP